MTFTSYLSQPVRNAKGNNGVIFVLSRDQVNTVSCGVGSLFRLSWNGKIIPSISVRDQRHAIDVSLSPTEDAVTVCGTSRAAHSRGRKRYCRTGPAGTTGPAGDVSKLKFSWTPASPHNEETKLSFRQTEMRERD